MVAVRPREQAIKKETGRLHFTAHKSVVFVATRNTRNACPKVGQRDVPAVHQEINGRSANLIGISRGLATNAQRKLTPLVGKFP